MSHLLPFIIQQEWLSKSCHGRKCSKLKPSFSSGANSLKFLITGVIMKKMCNIELLWGSLIAVAFLLTPTLSVADYYVLQFKTSRKLVKVYLSVEPDTKTFGISKMHRFQAPLLSSDHSDSQESETVSGLPISDSPPSVQSQPPELTSTNNDECHERRAVRGSPISTQSQPLHLTSIGNDKGHGHGAVKSLPLSSQSQPLDLTSIGNDEGHEPGAVGGLPISTQSQPLDLTSIGNDEGHKPGAVGGLPISTQSQPLDFTSIGNDEGHESGAVGGLPISTQSQPIDFTSMSDDGEQEQSVEGMPLTVQRLLEDLTLVGDSIDLELEANEGLSVSAQGQSLKLSSVDLNQPVECEAIGGLSVSQTSGPAQSPVLVHIFDSDNERESTPLVEPLTSQPVAGSKNLVHFVPTEIRNVYLHLERREENDSVYWIRVPSKQLPEFIRVFASLVAMEAKDLYTHLPFPRCGSFVCNSIANPSWYRGKFALLTSLILTSAGTGFGYGIGISNLGTGTLAGGLLSLPVITLLYSYTRFPRQFQVGFTFSSSKLEIYSLQLIEIMLKCTGGYELVSFRLNEHHNSQTLVFNVRMPSAVDDNQLRTWLESRNHQWADLFQIEVSSISVPPHTIECETRF